MKHNGVSQNGAQSNFQFCFLFIQLIFLILWFKNCIIIAPQLVKKDMVMDSTVIRLVYRC